MWCGTHQSEWKIQYVTGHTGEIRNTDNTQLRPERTALLWKVRGRSIWIEWTEEAKTQWFPRAWFAQGTSSGPWSNHSREKGQQNHKKWGWIGKQTNPDNVLKSRDIALQTNVCIGLHSFSFSSSCAWMWKLDRKEGWTPKNWGFWIVMLKKTVESPFTTRRSN